MPAFCCTFPNMTPCSSDMLQYSSDFSFSLILLLLLLLFLFFGAHCSLSAYLKKFWPLSCQSQLRKVCLACSVHAVMRVNFLLNLFWRQGIFQLTLSFLWLPVSSDLCFAAVIYRMFTIKHSDQFSLSGPAAQSLPFHFCACLDAS